jgi:DNA-binding NtrC family response regulator
MRRILIVDDDPRIVQLLGDWFRQKSYTVDIATNAGEASAVARRQRPDLVLLDVMLSGVSGIHLLREIKKVYPAIAVIMMTGNDTAALAAEALEDGAAAVVQKPCDLAHLDRLVAESFMKQEKDTRSPRGGPSPTPVSALAPMADDRAIQENISLLMASGVLPVGEITGRRVGLVAARVCDACNDTVRPTERAVELEFWKTIAVNLHEKCAEFYETELRRRAR